MNTANLQLEGLYMAVAALTETLKQKGLLDTTDVDGALARAERSAVDAAERGLSAANIEAISFPIRLLRVANATSFAGLDASTFRDRYEVTMENSSLSQQTVEEIKKIDGVAEVTAHYEIINGFQTLQKVLNFASSVIIVVLFVL